MAAVRSLWSSRIKGFEGQESGAGGDGFTVYEDLTFVNRKLLQMARNEHKDTPVWTIDGKVFLNVDGRVRAYIPSEDKTRLPLYPHAR